MRISLVFLLSLLCACNGSSSAADTVEPRTDVTDHVPAGEPDINPLDIEDVQSDLPREVVPLTLPTEPLTPQLFTDQLPAATEGIVFDGKGSFYLSSTDARVFKVNAQAEVEVFAELPPVEDGVNPGTAGIALSPNGTLFVCRFDADRIDSVPVDSPDAPGVFLEDIDTPNTLLFEDDGTMWYTSSGGHNDWKGHIGRIPHGGQAEVLVTDVTYANGLAISPDREWLYFSSSQPGSIHRCAILDDDSVGPPQMVADDEELTVADGLLMGRDGTLFIAGFAAGRILAWREDELTTVATTDDMSFLGTASLAWGEGEGFSPTAIFSTNLLKPHVYIVELGN